MYDFNNREFYRDLMQSRQQHALQVLRTTDKRHGAGRACITDPTSGEKMYCVMGVLADAIGIDPLTLSWNSRIDDYEKVAARYGLVAGFCYTLMDWNDNTMMSFSEIADATQQRLDLAYSRNPFWGVGILETNRWIIQWMLDEETKRIDALDPAMPATRAITEALNV